MNAKLSFNFNAKRQAKETILLATCNHHSSLSSAHCTCTLNMLAIAKYSCRVFSLTFGIQGIGRAVCGHSLSGIEGSTGALMSHSLPPVGLSVVRWWYLRSAYPCQEGSYRMCMPECRRHQTKKE
jgi:hypothetical protein